MGGGFANGEATPLSPTVPHTDSAFARLRRPLSQATSQRLRKSMCSPKRAAHAPRLSTFYSFSSPQRFMMSSAAFSLRRGPMSG